MSKRTIPSREEIWCDNCGRICDDLGDPPGRVGCKVDLRLFGPTLIGGFWDMLRPETYDLCLACYVSVFKDAHDKLRLRGNPRQTPPGPEEED